MYAELDLKRPFRFVHVLSLNKVDLLLGVWLFPNTFRLNVPYAGKQPKLGCFSAFLCVLCKNMRYIRCIGGNVLYLHYVCSEVVNAGNVVSKMHKKVLICVRNGSMQCWYAYMSTYFSFFFLKVNVRSVRWAYAACVGGTQFT